MARQALIMAGGKGTRLQDVTHNDIPKPMVRLHGKPLLEYAVLNLKKCGVTEIFISVGHLSEKITEYFGNGEKWNVKIQYIVENVPLGSGGALFYLKDKVADDFVVCMGDALFDVDIDRMLAFHKQNGAVATLLTHPNCHPYDSDLIVTDGNNRVVGINKKGEERNYFYKNNVNAGFFVISPKSLYYFSEPRKVNMEADFISSLIADGQKVMAYKSSEYIRDVGTPERYQNALKDIQNGLVAKRNLKNKQKAIFLDRDGTINKYVGFLTDASQFQLTAGAENAIVKINKSEYLAIVVSNQPVIARGECTFEEQENIMNKMETLLGKSGAFLDAIYYCPHHPHGGYEGEVKELKIQCDCRKPSIGLLKRAADDFNLDLSKCFIIGDSNVDIQTGQNAGIPAVRVKSELQEQNALCGEFCAENLEEAVDYVLSR